MNTWIKLWKDMINDPRLLEAAARLFDSYHIGIKTSSMGGDDLSNGDASRFGRAALLGALVTLWEYADTYIRDDDTLPLGADGVNALVGIEGFCDVIPNDWLLELDNGTIKLPGYCLKNQLVARRKRAADGKHRTAKWRASNAKGDVAVQHGDLTVTLGVTRHKPVSESADRDIDLDKDKNQEKNGGASSAPPLVLDGITDQPVEPKAHASLPPLAWQQWLQYRRKRRFPMDPLTLGLHLKLLSEFDTPTQVGIIETSIGSGWQGLFGPKSKPKPEAKRRWHPDDGDPTLPKEP